MNVLLLVTASFLIAWLAYLLGQQKSKWVKNTKPHLSLKLSGQESEDKTQIKQTEEALRSSERRYATLAQIAPVGIFHTSATGRCLYVNEQ